MKVAVLAGGVGGARFLRALTETTEPTAVTAIVNVGDDLDIAGLHVAPDLDTVLYTLAGLSDEERGWGRAGETWQALDSVAQLGGESWFRLGDRDIGLHLARTQALRAGEPLSAVTARLAAAAGLELRLLPATDDRLRTWLQTPSGTFEFQEWFVRRRHADPVDGVRFEGADTARPAPGVLDALEDADLIAIAPSNPYVSIWPILSVAPIRAAVDTTPAHVASTYEGLIDVLVVDPADEPVDAPVRAVVTPTLLDEPDARRRVAEAVLDVAGAPA